MFETSGGGLLWEMVSFRPKEVQSFGHNQFKRRDGPQEAVKVGGCGMLGFTANCPNCRHSFGLELCGPAAPVAPAPAAPHRAQLALSGGGLLKEAALCASACTLDAEGEFRRLADTVSALHLSGWYYSGLDWQGARRLLQDAQPGAFLVRDSSDRNFIFTLSVQTARGPTSVRLHYERGLFRLDCEPRLAPLVPAFPCAVELAQHYVAATARGARATVWVDAAGCPYSRVAMRAGLVRRPHTLAHLARCAVHRSLPKDAPLPHLPRALSDYLAEYPYSC